MRHFAPNTSYNAIVFKRRKVGGAGEMAQLVKCLEYKHEEHSLILAPTLKGGSGAGQW